MHITKFDYDMIYCLQMRQIERAMKSNIHYKFIYFHWQLFEIGSETHVALSKCYVCDFLFLNNLKDGMQYIN